MAYRVCCGRPITWILIVSDAIVVLTQVVSDVQRRYCAPREELLRHTRIVNLMYNYVKVVYLCQGVHLELASPTCILPNPVDVIIYIFVVLDKELVELLILFDVVCTLLTKLFVMFLCAFELVT